MSLPPPTRTFARPHARGRRGAARRRRGHPVPGLRPAPRRPAPEDGGREPATPPADRGDGRRAGGGRDRVAACGHGGRGGVGPRGFQDRETGGKAGHPPRPDTAKAAAFARFMELPPGPEVRNAPSRRARRTPRRARRGPRRAYGGPDGRPRRTPAPAGPAGGDAPSTPDCRPGAAARSGADAHPPTGWSDQGAQQLRQRSPPAEGMKALGRPPNAAGWALAIESRRRRRELQVVRTSWTGGGARVSPFRDCCRLMR